MTSGPPSGPSSMAASRRPPLPLLIIGWTILVVGLVVGLAAFAGPVVGNHGLRVADLLQLFAGRWTRDARLFWAVALGHRGLSIMSTPRGHNRETPLKPDGYRLPSIAGRGRYG